MTTTDNKELRDLIQVLTPFIYVLTEEEGRLLQWLQTEYSQKKRHKFKVWKRSRGLQDLDAYVQAWTNLTMAAAAPDESANPNTALMRILGETTPNDRHYYIILDAESLLDGRDPMVTRRFLDLAEQVHQNRESFKSMIFVSNTLTIPSKMNRMVRVASFDLPDDAVLRKNLDEILKSDHAISQLKVDRDAVVTASRGLAGYEADLITLENLALHKRLDPEDVRRAKVDIIRKNPLLELVNPNITFSDIGGMSRLKGYLQKRRHAWTADGKKYGLPQFKGVLTVGLPGNGKSLICKGLAHEWGLPLVKFDPSKLFAGQVGQSEANMRMALSTLERMAPCVAGDTQILMADGTLMTAEEIFERPNMEAVELLTVDPDTGLKVSSHLRMITKKLVHEHGAVSLETQGGTVTVRGDHQLWTSKGFREAKDLVPGDRIRALKHKYVAGNPLPITNILPEGTRAYRNDDPKNTSDGRLRGGRDYVYLHEDNLNVPYVKYSTGRGGYTDSYITTLPATVVEELGELVGYIDSEGSWEGRSVLIYNTDQNLLDRCVAICETNFGYTPTQHLHSEAGSEVCVANGPVYYTNKNCYVLRIDLSIICRTLENLRDDLLKWEYSYLLPAYLRAFINGDGHIREAHITITQKKPVIKARVMEVLRRLEIYVREPDKNIEITGTERVSRLLDLMSKAPSYEGDKVSSCVWPVAPWTFTRGVYESEAHDAVDVELKKVTIITDPNFVVYDLSCGTPHTYVGGGLVHHNCIAWVDEVEKGLAGMQSSTYSDSGTTARVIGSFLTWMQEVDSDVILMATANDVSNLPPELLRRFDEVFFVGLPMQAEREEIFRIHILKVERDPKKYDLVHLGKISENRSGAEIEKAISEALYVAYDDGKREMTTEDIAEAIRVKPPIIVTMGETLRKIQDWVGKDEKTGDGVRARFAHGLEDTPKMEAV